MSDYKINPDSIPENATIYKKVELTDKDVIGNAKITLEDMVMEAYKHALKEGIKANTVILDEHFCKVNGFDFLVYHDYKYLPPMICGLEIRGISKGEMPAGYNFSVLESPMTERDALIRDAKRGMIRRIWSELNDALVWIDDVHAVEDVVIDKIMNKMLKELNDTNDQSLL